MEACGIEHAAVQYAELVFAIWNRRQVFHAIMVGITMAACLRTTLRTYTNRRMLIRCCRYIPADTAAICHCSACGIILCSLGHTDAQHMNDVVC